MQIPGPTADLRVGTSRLMAWKYACQPTPWVRPKMLKTPCLNGRTWVERQRRLSQAERVESLLGPPGSPLVGWRGVSALLCPSESGGQHGDRGGLSWPGASTPAVTAAQPRPTGALPRLCRVETSL